MPEEIKFVSKANGVYKRDYAFRINVMEEIFEIKSCIEMKVTSFQDTLLFKLYIYKRWLASQILIIKFYTFFIFSHFLHLHFM